MRRHYWEIGTQASSTDAICNISNFKKASFKSIFPVHMPSVSGSHPCPHAQCKWFPKPTDFSHHNQYFDVVLKPCSLDVAAMAALDFFLTPLLPASHNANRFLASFLVPLLYFLHLIVFFIVLTVQK